DGDVLAERAHHGAQRARTALALLLVGPLLALRHAGAPDRSDAEEVHDARHDLAVAMLRDEDAHLAPVVPEGRQDHVLAVPCRRDEGLVLRPEAGGDVAPAHLETPGAAHEANEERDEPGDERGEAFALEDFLRGGHRCLFSRDRGRRGFLFRSGRLADELRARQLRIEAAPRDEFVMRALFDDTALVDDADEMRML